MSNNGLSRRKLVKGTAWSVPAVIASTSVPAFTASAPKLAIQSGLFVSTQYNGGFVGYVGSNSSTGHATSPSSYFAAAPGTQESDLNWNDGTSKPTSISYVNGEGSFTPVTNGATASNGSYLSASGFWFSVPTTDVNSGTSYVAGSNAVLAAGATFVTQVEFTIPAGTNAAWPGSNVTVSGQAWNKAISGNLNTLKASAPYLQTAAVAGTWSASTPTNTKNADGSYTFRGTITFKTTTALTLTQSGTKYYAQVIIMPATVQLNPAYGWNYFSLTSSIQSASITYTGNGVTSTTTLSGSTTTSRINP